MNKLLQIDVFEDDDTLTVGFLYHEGLTPTQIMSALAYLADAIDATIDEVEKEIN
jgi:predicted enzyme related to lactoylglutathione lyase